MNGKYASPRVLFPKTIAEALELSDSEPEALFWAGGTRFAENTPRHGNFIDLPRVVIALSLVEELARASRSENSLEIGAMMSLDRLAGIGRNALPAGLSDVLSSIGTRPLRSRATIGGNLGSKGRRGDLTPILQLLDAKVEIRYLRERKGRRKPVPSVRRIPLVLLEEEDGLRRGDLITRISIPTELWNFAVVEKLPPSFPGAPELIFQAVARLDKGTLVDWRMSFWDGWGPILKNRNIEASLAGSPLPLPRRSLDTLDDAVSETTSVWKDRKTDREAAKSLARAFMKHAAG